MITKNRSKVRWSAIALGAVLIGSPMAARAAEPTSSSEADAVAQQFREQAAGYRALGGVGYKSGLVQRAEVGAAKYAALAEQLRAPVAFPPPRTPEAERYAQLTEHYRMMGGVAYKSGLVQRAEAQQREYEAASAAAPAAAEQPAVACMTTKPLITLACAD